MTLERMEIANTTGRVLARIVVAPIFFAVLGPIIGLHLFLILGGLAKAGVPVPISSVALLIGVLVAVLGPLRSSLSSIGLAAALVFTVLGFVVFLWFGFLTFLMVPLYTYGIGGLPALLTGIAFALLITLKAPKNVAFVLCGLVGALATLPNSESFKSDDGLSSSSERFRRC